MFSVAKTESVAIQVQQLGSSSHHSCNHEPQKERSPRKFLFQILAMDHHQQRRQDEAAALKWLCLLLQLLKQQRTFKAQILRIFPGTEGKAAATAAAGALQRSPLRGVKPFHQGGPQSSTQLFNRNSHLTCLEFSTVFSRNSQLARISRPFFTRNSQLAWNSRPFFLLGNSVATA
jgi:hypothetical protein